MAIDSTQAVRKAGMAQLRAAEVVTDIVGNRVYPQSATKEPAWPFIKWGAPIVSPVKASCLDGSQIDFAVHGFAKARDEGGSVVETAEDHASRLGAAIAQALDGLLADIPNGTASYRWTGARLQEDEDGGFHTIQTFRARCMTARTG
ncbi:hypothetical protein GCM10011380_00660 [Sphingomonas metalli]|uniref:DUF3168 domain-containing protein n=1 Tax=Sphingomonas metalli TaxID=1779358 RepID=A0A916WNP8_9SPHN|nr:DUF3168 domain-containing protein [Sphingomonas metalli]GGB15118.1 hypothetical protein GCM10011380_00660 [Sphingomonas metalli]